jgi:hypothetical protein
MNEQLIENAAEPQHETQELPRILARRMARELTLEELDQVSGGMAKAGGYTATSCCCDCDACDA